MICQSCKAKDLIVKYHESRFILVCWKCKALGKEVSKDEAKEIVANHVVMYGKHKGKKIKDVPDDYLRWLALNSQGDLTELALFWLKTKADRS